MDSLGFQDGNVYDWLDQRYTNIRKDIYRRLQMHSSLVRRLSQETELEGHQGCVNSVAWNSGGSLLISGSDDTRVNIWSYSGRKLLHSIDTGHNANIFCTKFVPETCDELVVSGAGDAEVRLFNLSHACGSHDDALAPTALYQCHARRVKKLAVEAGNPNVVWSASEDGTLRQHDLRETTTCPPTGSSHQECRNILLDLRCGAKESLSEPPKQILSLKSCDISSTRPHLLLVGGSDAFARLYDRRMLPPMSSSRKRASAPPCVNFFCPKHLSEFGRSSLHLTHVTFSPDGEEVLLSYSGEHVYLMDVNHGGKTLRYTSGDAAKMFSYSPVVNVVEKSQMPNVVQEFSGRKIDAAKLEKLRMLLETAKKSLEDGSDIFSGIEACSLILDGMDSYDCGSAIRLECLCTRAGLLLKRKWKNDALMAIRDAQSARKIDGSSFTASYYMVEALHQLGKCKEALDVAAAAQLLAPSDSRIVEKMESIKKDLTQAEVDKTKAADGPRSESRTARVLSLNDILYRSEANSDASLDMSRSEREDSDYDEELELDFETSLSGDEGRDVDSNVLHGSLNVRIHRRGETSRDNTGTNGSCGSPSSSSQNEKCSYQPEGAIDMKRRYVGHCNVGTDIKQASFLGQQGEYVASGSDDGRWFIWEKKTGRLIKILFGDEAVVNCIQCHPFDGVVATSGIDKTIKLWTPSAPVPQIVAGGAAGPETANFLEIMEANQRRLCRNWETIILGRPSELLERFRMQEFTEGNLHPFECTQS